VDTEPGPNVSTDDRVMLVSAGICGSANAVVRRDRWSSIRVV